MEWWVWRALFECLTGLRTWEVYLASWQDLWDEEGISGEEGVRGYLHGLWGMRMGIGAFSTLQLGKCWGNFSQSQTRHIPKNTIGWVLSMSLSLSMSNEYVSVPCGSYPIHRNITVFHLFGYLDEWNGRRTGRNGNTNELTLTLKSARLTMKNRNRHFVNISPSRLFSSPVNCLQDTTKDL